MPKVEKQVIEQLVKLIDDNFQTLTLVQKRYLADQAYFYYKKKVNEVMSTPSVPEQTQLPKESNPTE